MAMDIRSSSSKSSSGFLSTSRLLQHGSAPEAEFSMGTTPYIASPRSTALKALTSRKEDHGFENFKQIDVDQYVTNIQWSIYWRRMNFLYICRMYILYLTCYLSIFTATIKWNNITHFQCGQGTAAKDLTPFCLKFGRWLKKRPIATCAKEPSSPGSKKMFVISLLTGWVRFLVFVPSFVFFSLLFLFFWRGNSTAWLTDHHLKPPPKHHGFLCGKSSQVTKSIEQKPLSF